MTHCRTVQTERVMATVRGTGPGTVVSMMATYTDAGSAVEIPIYEFPEAVARSLLTASALNDEALRVTT